MTTFMYCSRSKQVGMDREECMTAAELICTLLDENAVLTRPVLSMTHIEGAWMLDITASVEANGADRLATFMVLDAADEQWARALLEADCSSAVVDSCLSAQNFLV